MGGLPRRRGRDAFGAKGIGFGQVGQRRGPQAGQPGASQRGVRAGVVRPGQTLTGMGMDLDPEVTENMLNDWITHGLARHGNFLSPEHIAQAVAAMVTMPRGAHMRSVEVEAEGAIPRDKSGEGDTK